MPTAKVKVEYPYVIRTKDIQGGCPVIAGTRIPVSTLIIEEAQQKAKAKYPERDPD